MAIILCLRTGKWGVINGKGEFVIEPTYDEMITVPNSTKFQKERNLNRL